MRALLIIGMALMLTASAPAAVVQARLIRASNDREGHDAQLKEIEPKLAKKFGYKFYHQLGGARAALPSGRMQRLDLGEGFVLFATAQGEAKKEHILDMEWYSGKALLVRSTVKIATDGHLFIKGPEVGNDWIVLAVSIHE